MTDRTTSRRGASGAAVIALPAAIRVGIYARISSDSVKDELGVKRQFFETKRLAAEKGWEVVETYVDNDITAAGPVSKAKPRPEYDRLVDDIRAGRLDAIMAWDLDRLIRRPVELEELMDVCERHGVRDLATVSGTIDFGTGDGMLVARIKGAVAAEEVEKMRKRQLSKQAELAREGKYAGGHRSYGYEPRMSGIVEHEAKMIREAVGRVLDGESVNSIAVDWNEAGVPTVFGKLWRSSTLRDILVSPRLAGLRTHHGVVVAPAEWPAIIDRATHEQLLVTLQRRNRGRTKQGRRLLTGLLVCVRCGNVMTSGQNNGVRAYGCVAVAGTGRGCFGSTARADRLESVIVEAVLDQFDSGLLDAMRSQRTKAVDPADVELIAEVEAHMLDLAAMLGAREIDRAGYAQARAIADAELQGALRRVERSQTASAIDGFLDDSAEVSVRWEAASLIVRRAVLAACIEQITLRPAKRGGPRFQPERVDIIWRH